MNNFSSPFKAFFLINANKKTIDMLQGLWYRYRGRMKGSDINSLGLLPDKLKTELAIHVNLETLKRVSVDLFSAIFQQ